MKEIGVIIVAGGSGSRMGGVVPKQFLPLHGIPILAITLRKFIDITVHSHIVVVLPESEIDRWEEICVAENLQHTHTICIGGANRFDSVKRGLEKLPECEYIAIHDGVRPLVSTELILHCLETARIHGNAIPAVRPVDSFRVVTENETAILDRDTMRAIQTPQIFCADILRTAYDTPFDPAFTDDASVVERYGVKIVLCEGDPNNIKVTTPIDLAVAEAIISSKRQ